MEKSKTGLRLTLPVLIVMLCSSTLAFQLKAADEVLLSVDPNTQISFGEEFNVTLQADNMLPASNIVGFEIQLNWDPSLLTGVNITDVLYHSITPKADWNNIWILSNRINNTVGNVHFAYTFQDVDSAVSAGYAPITGNHTLAILTLRALNKTGTSPLNFTFAKVGGYYIDKWGQFITTTVPVNATGGSVVANAPSGTICIRFDGSIDPASAPISTSDNVTYTLTNNVTSNGDGIFIERDNVTLDGAGYILQGTGIRDSKGISLVTVTNVTITKMNIVSFWEGIYLNGGWQNNIVKNRIASNNVGIDIYSGRHTIIENDLVNNDLWCTLGRYNKIYHNNVINSSAHVAQADLGDYNQIWDGDYPVGGNYWSSYNGTDLYSGPNQNETGSDGLGDTPYGILYYENMDHYPLMKPYSGSHDVGVTSMDTSKNVVGRGCGLNASIRIINYGGQTETVNATLYANSTIVDELSSIVLSGRNSTTLTYAWNTSGFACGIYNVTACVSPVPNETDSTDNSHCAWVILTLPGDIDGDFFVNRNDVVRLVGVFGSRSGNLDWNPNADINGDNTVDIYDAIILAGNFGKTA